MTDLGTPGSDPESQANSINSRGQVVGTGFVFAVPVNIDLHGFLWENGSIVDVNTLLPPGTGVTVSSASDINDRGEIAASGFDSNGDAPAFLLIPCDEDHKDVEGCDYDPVEAVTAAPVLPAQLSLAPTEATATSLTPSPWKDRMRTLLTNAHRTFWGSPRDNL